MRWIFAEKPKIVWIVLLILAFFVFLALLPGIGIWSVVDAGHVGIVTRFGAVERVVRPGLVLKLPFIDGVSSMETRTQKEQVEAVAASKDLLQVTSTIALNFHLKGEQAVAVYQDIGEDYNNRVIAPATQEVFKSTTSQFTTTDLIAKREDVKQRAYTTLKERLDKYNIVVDDLNIVNFAFSKEYRTAIEQKTIAEQNKERAQIEAQNDLIKTKNDAETTLIKTKSDAENALLKAKSDAEDALIKAKSDAESARIKAKGEADAQKLLKDSGSLTPEYLQFLKIQKWDGKLPTTSNGDPFPQLP